MLLLLSMLPIYLLGNLHCLGMCGPIVMMLGKHRYRYCYFLGRTLSFTLAGLLAGEIGAVLNLILVHYHLPAAISFIFGTTMILLSVTMILQKQMPLQVWVGQKLAGFNQTLTLLLLRDQPLTTFLFGFFTLALPCGQTLLVFSACALSGNSWTGFMNGLAFALLTSPSLLCAMQTHVLIHKLGRHYNTLVGICAFIVGALTLCRGLADIGIMPHCVLNQQYHLVLF